MPESALAVASLEAENAGDDGGQCQVALTRTGSVPKCAAVRSAKIPVRNERWTVNASTGMTPPFKIVFRQDRWAAVAIGYGFDVNRIVFMNMETYIKKLYYIK